MLFPDRQAPSPQGKSSTERNPVFITRTAENGEQSRTRVGGNNYKATTLSDEEVDSITEQAMQMFPSIGREMLAGYFKHIGHPVTRKRIRASQERVRGIPASFARRTIVRREYNVKGPMSLWHHDGQHGAKRLCTILSKVQLAETAHFLCQD